MVHWWDVRLSSSILPTVAVRRRLASRKHVTAETVANGEGSERSRLGRWGHVLQRVCRLSRAGIGVVDEAAATKGQQGLIRRSDTVACFLTLLTALLGRACDDGLELGFAVGDGCDGLEDVVCLARGVDLDGRCHLGSHGLCRVDVVVLGDGGPRSGVDGLAVAKLRLDHGGDCRTDGGAECCLSEGAGLSSNSGGDVDSLLDENTLEAVHNMGKLLDVLRASCLNLGRSTCRSTRRSSAVGMRYSSAGLGSRGAGTRLRTRLTSGIGRVGRV